MSERAAYKHLDRVWRRDEQRAAIPPPAVDPERFDTKGVGQ